MCLDRTTSHSIRVKVFVINLHTELYIDLPSLNEIKWKKYSKRLSGISPVIVYGEVKAYIFKNNFLLSKILERIVLKLR